MKWILLAMMSASSSNSPMLPTFMTAEFGDKPACESAARSLNDVTQRWRVGAISYACVPQSSTPG